MSIVHLPKRCENAVEIHERRRIFDDFFKIEEAQVSFELYSGAMSPVVRRLNFERGESAAAIVFHRERGEVILVEQFRYPVYEHGPGWLLETVAGIIEDGETPRDSIEREIAEEIGYKADRVEPIASFYVSPGGTSEKIHLFLAEVSEAGRVAVGGGLEKDAEDIRIVSMPLAEALEKLESGEIQDAKTIIALQRLALVRS